MNILMIHGYLLSGTGSNLFVNSTVRELCKNGHNVYLLCQEYSPENFDYISEAYEFDTDNRNAQALFRRETNYPGKCFFYRPNLHGFLPVYVYDQYPDFKVKEFPDCNQNEIENYISYNYKAAAAILQTTEIDVLQTNHAIMSPYIGQKLALEFDLPLFITIHGSALNFSVRPHKKLQKYTFQPFESARNIFVLSDYAKKELSDFLAQNKMSHIIKKIKTIYAGVDIDSFNILSQSKSEYIKKFKKEITPLIPQSRGKTAALNQRIFNPIGPNEDLLALTDEIRKNYDAFHIDKDIIQKIDRVNWDKDNIIIFIGKYLWTKGLHLILLAAPLILKEFPDTKFLFVGFGPFREICELIINALDRKDDDLLEKIYKSFSTQLPLFKETLEKEGQRIFDSLNMTNTPLKDSILFTGKIDHSGLKYLLPCADVLIAPSVFPEAFGIIAVEALAAGVYPILTHHSAFVEMRNKIARALKPFNFKPEKILLNSDTVRHIYSDTISFFNLKEKLKADGKIKELKTTLRSIAEKDYTWRAVTQRLLSAYENSTAD